MSDAEKSARTVRRAAEREHAGPAGERERDQSDSDAAGAHPALTDTRLRKGHPPLDDWRDKPVDEEPDKDIRHGEESGRAAQRRGG